MNSPLKTNTETIQELLDKINSLPEAGSDGVELPELTNEGSASDLLSGKELIDQDGNIVTGTIPTKTSSDLTASGATVTVPAGYYETQVTKSVATTTRADTTISVTADDTNDKLTITASNNQSTGYVAGANKTASKTISLTAFGATVTASDGTNSISKSVTTAAQATPSISVDANGKITASATQTAGYVSAGTKTGTKQLPTQAAKTVTPTKSAQTAVASGVYTTGAVTVASIPSQYITTTDATASADEIMSGETAYVNGSKVTGTFTIDNELTAQDNLISQIQTALQNKASASEPVLQTKTVTPTASAQNVTPDSGYDGLSKVTVNGDANLIPANIAEGVSIFGITGTHSGGSSGGGSVETITVTYKSVPEPDMMIHYIDGTMSLQSAAITRGSSYTIAKNTIFVVECYMSSDFDGCSAICGNSMCKAFLAIK